MPIGTAQGLEDAAAGQGVRAEDRGAGDRAADTHRTHVGGRNLVAGTRAGKAAAVLLVHVCSPRAGSAAAESRCTVRAAPRSPSDRVSCWLYRVPGLSC